MRRLVLIMVTFVMLFSTTIGVVANDNIEPEKKVVRVGAFSVMHMQEKNDKGEYVGYSYDYLNSLLPYTNWQYEYVEGSVAECLEWLKSGEIDIMGGLAKIPEREDYFDFVDYYSGYNGTKLLVKNNSTKYAAEDYGAYDGMIIGVQSSTVHHDQAEEFSAEKGFSASYKFYETEQQVLDALEKNEIDAACLAAIKVEDWTRVIAVFDVTPYFYAVTKNNNELLTELNNAIGSKKNDDPMFEENLRRQYYTNETGNYVVFSEDEQSFIASSDTIKVAYDSDFLPIEGNDAKTGLPSGYTIEVLKKISDMTGLQFEYQSGNSYQDDLHSVLNGEVDILSSFTKSISNVPIDQLSNYYMNLSVVLMGKNGRYFDSYDEITIATTLRTSEFINVVQKIYPNSNFKIFETGEEAYRAVENNKADLVIRNSYSAQLDVTSNYEDFRVILDLNQNTQSYFLFSEKMPKELISIFNKCIASFTEAEMNAMMMRVTLQQVDTHAQTIRIVVLSILIGVLVIVAILLCQRLFKARRRLVFMAYNDDLTKLPNLTKFKIEAKKILQENSNQRYAILLTDIADFSFINEKYGFEVGDLVIKSVGDTINSLKAPTTLTARIFSNMFITLYQFDEKEEKKLTSSYEFHNFEYNDMIISFFHYFGRYIIPLGEIDVDNIYEKVSYAHLFAKKNSIKARIVDYDEEAKLIGARNQELEAKMHDALKRNDFKLYLQAKYRCDGTTIAGAEALVRWNDSTTGKMIYPDEFIPLFERNGFVLSIDMYMFEEVCKLLSNWKRKGIELITISVNFSRLHFSNIHMADELLKIAKKYDIETKYLEIEITENALSSKTEEISAIIDKLCAYGFKISLDDFSSQHSSLLFLADVPVDVVKLDKGFVSAILEKDVNRLLVEGTIQILKKLDFVVVAEGVESLEQVSMLEKMQCDMIQGYVFSKPIPAREITKILLKNK